MPGPLSVTPLGFAFPPAILAGPLALLPVSTEEAGGGPLPNKPTTQLYGELPKLPNLPSPPEPFGGQALLPHPRDILDRVKSRADSDLARVRGGVQGFPTPREAVDELSINPPTEIIGRVPTPGDLLDAGPLRDLNNAFERVLYHAPGVIGDIHNLRRSVRMATDDIHTVVENDVPEITASMREHGREITEQGREVISWGIDSAPEFLEPIKIMAQGIADGARGIVEAIPHLPSLPRV